VRIGTFCKAEAGGLEDWRRVGLADFNGSGAAGLIGYGRIVWRASLSENPEFSSSKLSSDRSIVPSSEANAFSLSEESIPPKLSCGRRCGNLSALGEIAVAKSSSQLSSCADSGERNLSVVLMEVGDGRVSTRGVFREDGMAAGLW
jgi:hypothetical protein